MIRQSLQKAAAIAALTLPLALIGCGGSDDPASHTLGGTISGLTGNGLVIANGSDTLSVSAGATSFSMPGQVRTGASYALTVQTQPAGQVCAFAGASGTMPDADVTTAVLTCASNAATVGGSVSGLNETGLVLANGSDTITVAAGATAFTMGVPVTNGSAYGVTVQTHPAWQRCSVGNGSGTISGGNVSNVTVTCVASVHVSTIAGYSGFEPGGMETAVGTLASFNSPSDVAADAQGNLYVADTRNNAIRKIAPDGTVTILAGDGSYAYADGPGATASFAGPTGVAADGNGNVYVADADNGLIRKIAPDGTVSTLAGTPGLFGLVDGAGNAAQFDNPSDVAVDATGNVYVADRNNNAIRKIAPDGTTTTLAGGSGMGYADGPGATAQFADPSGVAVDGIGNVYVAEQLNQRVRKVAPDGTVSTLSGTGDPGTDDGPGATATFEYPASVDVDGSGNVYVAQYDRVRRIAPDGTTTTLAGRTDNSEQSRDGRREIANFYPRGLALAGNGRIVFVDWSSRVRVIDNVEPEVSTVAYVDTLRSVEPTKLAVDGSGNIYFIASAHAIGKLAPDGTLSTLAGDWGTFDFADGPGATARFSQTFDIAVDASGNLYVADSGNNRIRKVAPDGTVTTLAGDGTAGYADGPGASAQFNNPRGVAVDGAGNVYVGDTGNQRIRKITPAGVVSTLAGTGVFGQVNGPGASAQFQGPANLAVDASGNVYVTENALGLRKVAPDGTVSTLVTGGLDFGVPRGVAVDGSGNVVVALAGGVSKVAPNGTVTVLAGNFSQAPADSSRANAAFGSPNGVAVSATGDVFVADGASNAIRKIRTAP